MRNGNALLKFLKAEVVGKLDDWFEVAPGSSEEGMGPLLRLICLPGLPGTEKMREPVIDLLQSSGIDGAFTMRAMLEHLLRRAEETSDYNGSAEEGSVFTVRALVTDDVQVKNVFFYLNGERVAVDGGYTAR